MKKNFVFCILILLFGINVNGQVQDTVFVENDTLSLVKQAEGVLMQSDSVKLQEEKIILTEKQLNSKPAFKPSPKKAVIYSAIFPGMGQIYNRKYWKLPLIYGGIVALSYGISWNGQYYSDYKNAYSAIAVENPRSNFNNWKDMANLPNGTDPATIPDNYIESYKSQFKRKKDFYRRNRDLCIIGVVAVYAVSMIDAYVDAQLFDFDISPDLSMKVSPTVMQSSVNPNKSFGLQCNFKF